VHADIKSSAMQAQAQTPDVQQDPFDISDESYQSTKQIMRQGMKALDDPRNPNSWTFVIRGRVPGGNT
jgi:hypothetical protein